MVASPADLVARLGAADAEQRLRAIRDVKNQIIGNKSKKLSYIKLGAVPRVVELLAASESEYGVRIQCAATVGSFAYGVDDGLQAVLESGGVSQLIQMLSSLDERIVEAGVRALKMVFQSQAASQSQLLTADALQRLVYLLLSDNRSVAEVAARVLARCCNTKEQQAVVAEAGGVAGLLRLLSSNEAPRREAAVDALASLTANNANVIGRVACSEEAIRQLLKLLKSPSAGVRFLAAQCLTNLAPALPCSNDDSQQSAQGVRKAVLPVLAKLLGDAEVREEVPHVLSQLLADNKDLQAAAADADAISKLASFLHHDGCSTRLKEGTLRALSTLCAEREASRRQLVDAHAMGAIVRALDDASAQVRMAACMCVRSLSRSIKSLRNSLVDADVAGPLFRRLSDPDPAVQNTASATLCNIVLDFSPVKEAVLAAGCIPVLMRLSGSADGELRLNAVWALQNLVYTACSDVRKAVLAALPWPHVVALADDMRPDVQERALNLLRNMCAHCSSPDVKLVLEWTNDEIYQLLISRVDPSASHPVSQRVHALYTLVNIAAAGEEEGREAVMRAGLPSMLPRLLAEGEEEARLAAVWCVINLTNSGEDYPEAPKRVAALREAGVSAVLAEMQKERLPVDIRERVKTALDNFVAIDMFTE